MRALLRVGLNDQETRAANAGVNGCRIAGLASSLPLQRDPGGSGGLKDACLAELSLKTLSSRAVHHHERTKALLLVGAFRFDCFATVQLQVMVMMYSK